MKTITDLVNLVANKEGKKHQAQVGDVKEIISILAAEMAVNDDAHEVFCKYVLKKHSEQTKKAKKKK